MNSAAAANCSSAASPLLKPPLSAKSRVVDIPAMAAAPPMPCKNERRRITLLQREAISGFGVSTHLSPVITVPPDLVIRAVWVTAPIAVTLDDREKKWNLLLNLIRRSVNYVWRKNELMEQRSRGGKGATEVDLSVRLCDSRLTLAS